jgi:hypothetical protein
VDCSLIITNSVHDQRTITIVGFESGFTSSFAKIGKRKHIVPYGFVIITKALSTRHKPNYELTFEPFRYSCYNAIHELSRSELNSVAF